MTANLPVVDPGGVQAPVMVCGGGAGGDPRGGVFPFFFRQLPPPRPPVRYPAGGGACARLRPQPPSALAHGSRLLDNAGPPRSAITPVSALLVRHLEGEAEARQVLAWVVGRVSKLWDQKVPRPLLFAAVDRGIEIDEMPAEIARRLQRDLDIALAVEGAGVADIAVVVNDSVDIRGLGPAGAFQMHGEGRAGRAALDIERQRGGLDPQTSRLVLGAILDRERVRTAEVVGNGEMKFDTARSIGHRLGDGSR